MSSFIKKFWISIILNVFVLVLCLTKTDALPQLEFEWNLEIDKVVHLLMFFVISGTIFFENTIHLKKKTNPTRILSASLLYPILFGGLIEILQTLSTKYNNRHGDWRDFAYDAIGVLLATLICFLLNKKLNNSET